MTEHTPQDPGSLIRQWGDDLASWAIPQEILDQADEKPWTHPVAMFTVDDTVADSPSHRAAREAVPVGGSVLDVGSGGGRAAMALVPPAGLVMGVDHQQAMLDAFSDAASRRGVPSRTFLGDWPDIADSVPEADVVVCHHVVYNVPEIGEFLLALDRHARRRVVLELPLRHPLSHLNPLWERFWGLSRPTRPAASDLHAIACALGFDANLEEWSDDQWAASRGIADEERIRFARIRLCLSPDRDGEIARALDEVGDVGPRRVATIWWDR